MKEVAFLNTSDRTEIPCLAATVAAFSPKAFEYVFWEIHVWSLLSGFEHIISLAFQGLLVD